MVYDSDDDDGDDDDLRSATNECSKGTTLMSKTTTVQIWLCTHRNDGFTEYENI